MAAGGLADQQAEGDPQLTAHAFDSRPKGSRGKQ
jgi:hypothetical protein